MWSLAECETTENFTLTFLTPFVKTDSVTMSVFTYKWIEKDTL